MIGIVITIVLCVLFVPIRYRVQLEYFTEEIEVKNPLENLKAKIKVGWLLRCISVNFENEKGQGRYRIKVFGFTILDSQANSKWERTKKRKKRRKEKPKVEKVKEFKKNDIPEPIDNKKPEDASSFRDLIVPLDKKKHCLEKNFFEKIKDKIIEFLKKCKNIMRSIKYKFKAIMNNGKRIKGNIKRIYSFIKNIENKKGFKKIRMEIKKVLKHIAPTKTKGYLSFGMDDPATTGKVVGGIAILYSIIGEKIQIFPNFQEKYLELLLDLKGRVRFFTLIKSIIVLWRNKEVKNLIENFNQLKEEL